METFIVVRASSPLLVAVSDWHFMGRELPDARSGAVLLIIFFSALAYVQKATLSLGAVAWSSAWLVVFVRRLAFGALCRVLMLRVARLSTSATSSMCATPCP